MTASGVAIVRHTVTFEGVDAPSQCAPAPSPGDGRIRASPPAERPIVTGNHIHIEGAFRGAGIAPHLLGGWNGAHRDETHGKNEVPRPASRAAPRTPVDAARQRVAFAEVKLHVERIDLMDKTGVVVAVDAGPPALNRATSALAQPHVTNLTFATTQRPGTSASSTRPGRCRGTQTLRRCANNKASNSDAPPVTRTGVTPGPHVTRPHTGASLAAARHPSRTGLLPAQGRCDASAAAALAVLTSSARKEGEGGRGWAWNLSPPSPPGRTDDDSSPEWNPGRITPW
jgi:hypothetical protein